MRQLALLTAIVVSLPTVASAETLETIHSSKVQRAVKVGLTLSKLMTDGHSGDVLMGPAVGVAVRMPITDYLGFQPELWYMQKGSEYRAWGADVSMELNYIELALLAHARLAEAWDGPGSLSFFAGPYLAALADANGNVTFDGSSDHAELDMKTFDVGLVAGGGFVLDLGHKELTIEARGELGVRDISIEEDTVRNRSLIFLAGLSF